MADLRNELETACRIAREAGAIALRHQGRIAYDDKSDDSPVTAADRDCERAITAALSEAFPADGMLGEEGADRPGTSGRRWIVDPIDGTREFVRGNPAWAVLIALEAGDDVLAGCAHFPAMGDTYYASLGDGAFRNGDRIKASSIDTVSRAVLCINSLNSVLRYRFAPHLLEWMRPFWAVRSLGGCLDAMMVAGGQADLWLETGGKPWDFAALKVIAQEAGARYFDFAGRDTIYGGNCVICAPGLEAEARRLVALG